MGLYTDPLITWSLSVIRDVEEKNGRQRGKIKLTERGELNANGFRIGEAFMVNNGLIRFNMADAFSFAVN